MGLRSISVCVVALSGLHFVSCTGIPLGAYPAAASAACPNEQFRTGPSAMLPDCRAYELVTPAELAGFALPGPSATAPFTTAMTPNGNNFFWSLLNSSLPGTESNGLINTYKSERGSDGWINTRFGPSASQAQGSQPGSLNANGEFMTLEVMATRGGTLAVGCQSTCLNAWIRQPDGSYRLAGEGTVPTAVDTDGFENGFIDDLGPQLEWISAAGNHQVIGSRMVLTPEAPAETFSLFDRTPTGLKFISFLPGEVIPTAASEFAGASSDGSTVLFKNEGNLYARVDNARTVELASAAGGEILAGGVNADGSIAFFVQEGEIYRYDFGGETAAPILNPGPGDAIISYVSADFSHVFFISETTLVPEKGTPGVPNLYVWDGSDVQFIATLNSEDLVHGSSPPRGLALWTSPSLLDRPPAVNGHPWTATARSTANGTIFAFESREQLTDYPTNGHFAIYRYDTADEQLSCVSCSPVSPQAESDSEFVMPEAAETVPALNEMLEAPSLSSDGQAIVFETADPLLPRDVNGVLDVYEWRAGSLSLISTGAGSRPSRLFGLSPSGDDIFLLTGQRLVGEGQNSGSYAVYDARVGGGFAAQQTRQDLECTGEACQGQPGRPPFLPQPGSLAGPGNAKACPRLRHSRTHHHRRKARASKGKSKHRHRRVCRAKRRRAGR